MIIDKYFKYIKILIYFRLIDNAKASFIKNKSDGSIEVSPIEYTRIARDNKNQKEASILPALCKSFGRTFLFGTFLKVIEDCLVFVSPQVLKYVFPKIAFIGKCTI